MSDKKENIVSGNLLDYIAWRGDLSFAASEFNDIDALIFSQLSYLHLDGLVSGDFACGISLRELSAMFVSSSDFEERKNIGMMINPLTLDLLLACGESARFGSVVVCGFVDNYNFENEEQFAALAFRITPSEKTSFGFIAFRGTDDTLIGWKEDFNLAFMKRLPAQDDALAYLNKFCESAVFRKLPFMTGGHSKGGNLALFSSARLEKKHKDRLLKVYNFDGPGFSQETLADDDFISIKDRSVSVFPQMSVVGMLFHHFDNYKVALSDQKFIMQHDPFSWRICAYDFIERPELAEGSEIFFKSFNSWFENLEPIQRELFVETLFGVILSSDAETSSELAKNVLKSAAKIIKAFASLDSGIRDSAIKMVMDFLKIAGNEIKLSVLDELKPELPAIF